MSAATIKELFKEHGIPEYRHTNWKDEPVSPREIKRKWRDQDVSNLVDRIGSTGRVVELAERVAEIGTPGTPIRQGQIRADSSPKAQPFVLRGRRGRPGDLDEYYRTEPILRDAVDSIVEVQMGATRSIHPPEEMPDGMSDEMDAWVMRLNMWFNNLDGGFEDSYVFPATQSMCIFGFAPFEVVWAMDNKYQVSGGTDGLAWPVKFAYRECSTVESWLMNDRQDTLLGVEFQTGGDASLNYQLTACGDTLTDQQLLNCRISGRGNNWEGVSPTRTSLHWVRFKRLLGQIAAVAAQKYGVPLTMIKVDPALIKDQLLTMLNVNEGDVDEAIAQFDAAEAVEAGVYYLPPPLTAETTSPEGTMPSLEALIRYCDEMMARPYSNEGALLGHNSVGSYALSEVSEGKFLRSAPAYARLVDGPINEIIRKMTIQRFGRLLPAYPTMQMQLGSQDASRLIADIVAAMGGMPMVDWPRKLQQEVLSLLGMPSDALDEEEQGVATTLDPGGPLGAPGEVPGEPVNPDRPVELAEPMLRSFQEFKLSAEDLSRFMDSAEDNLADEWKKIAEKQRREIRDLTDGVSSAQELDRIGDRVQAKYKPEYLEEAKKVADSLGSKGAAQVLKELGVDVKGGLDAPKLPPGIKEQVELGMLQAAKEANSRNTQNALDQRINQITSAAAGRQEGSVSKLATSTFRGIAARVVGTAFNASRASVVQSIASAGEASGAGDQVAARSPAALNKPGMSRGSRGITAVRTSMLDDRVCGPCNDLDFEQGGPTFIVGSASYYEHLPSKKCEGGNRCRCSMIYSVPDDLAGAAESVMDSLSI